MHPRSGGGGRGTEPPRSGVDFLVRGGTTVSADRFNVEVLLIDAKTGRSLWAETFGEDLTPANIVAVRDEAANGIAGTLAQPFGVIVSRKVQETEGRPVIPIQKGKRAK